DGATLDVVTLPVGGQLTAFASYYNYTRGYGGLLEVNWSQTPSLGSFDNLTGTSTTFTAGSVGGMTTITGENTNWGVSDTFTVEINPPTFDYILLADAPNGAALTAVVLNVGGQVTAYASGYNATSGYISLVEVNWSQSPSMGSLDNLLGTSTTFTAGLVGGSTVISGENATLGLSDTFDVVINPPTADYVQIRTQPGGGGTNLCDPGNYMSYPVGASDTYYGALYNLTAGYFTDAPGDATWASSNPSIVTVTSPGSSSEITCDNQNWGGPVVITLSVSGMQNTTQVTVLEPTVDFIQIRDEPNGLGNVVTTGTYIVWQLDVFYAAGYNDTAGYLGEVEATWFSNDTAVGEVTSPGLYTIFTAQEVDEDSLCQVTAELNGITDSTGGRLVLSPRIDFIVIVDASSGGGVWVASGTYDEGEEDVFWAAGHNLTSDYVEDVKATWESNDTVVGKVTFGPSEYTDFTAGWRGGFCRVTATYETLQNHTGPLFVINVNQLPTATAQCHNGTGFDGGNYSFPAVITLRVTGRKKNIITMELEEDGIVVEDVVVTRHSNVPDIGIISHDMDVHSVYEIVLSYNGHNGGSNPIIVTFEFMGNIYSVHLLFNSQHGARQKARIAFNDIVQLVGAVFLDASSSTDFEGYLVQYHWDFGDGTTGTGETLAHTYVDNGVYTVTLTVTDDEGGTDERTITVYVENIDNNNQANAALGSNASKGYLNDSGQYVVILQCPADLTITSLTGQQTGLDEGHPSNDIEGAFMAMSYGDIEVYYIPKEGRYALEVVGNGNGLYDMSVIDVNNNMAKKYTVYDVTCSENTEDKYIFNFEEERIAISSPEDEKFYSLEFFVETEDHSDVFYLHDMRLKDDAVHIYEIRNWEELSSGEPVTLFIDVDSDGDIDQSLNLESGLTGEEVEARLLKKPVTEPEFPLLLFFIIGFIFTMGVGTLLTEIGKWTLLSIFLPLYTRLKKEELLDQPTRYKIYGYLIGNPGAHFGLIKDDLELGSGQLVHHLKQLQDAKLIYSRQDGVKKRFYPTSLPKPKEGRFHVSDFQEKILGIIKRNEGIPQKRIAVSLGISRQVAGYHLTIMERKGVVNKKMVGRESRYYPSEE
ncbi:MAG: PKD domain-containing protein, partial [Thermoplasmata archaeon]